MVGGRSLMMDPGGHRCMFSARRSALWLERAVIPAGEVTGQRVPVFRHNKYSSDIHGTVLEKSSHRGYN